ncbi:hypothetical protein P7K49_005528 [Saguinus oedipus]|uniref:Small ribosomal subunit protein eS4 C-terminal domain-containing protein n=1 Tax=Saguinus oedipus TaxID=9490 RepID=A0ABQ9VZT3_SAGOE|nr:hypothetical protein P7K49_005528 [Saguinus oedipus]
MVLCRFRDGQENQLYQIQHGHGVCGDCWCDPRAVCVVTAGVIPGHGVCGDCWCDRRAVCVVTAGVITNRERQPGSFSVVHVKGDSGNSFATSLSSIFVTGNSNTPWISLRRATAIQLMLLKEEADHPTEQWLNGSSSFLLRTNKH